MKVIDSNLGFANIFGEEIEELFDTIPGLRGADFTELVPEVVSKMFVSLLSTGESMIERDLKVNNLLLHVSVNTIYKHRVVGALIRDMSAGLSESTNKISKQCKKSPFYWEKTLH